MIEPATQREQIEMVFDAVTTAVTQAAEISGLRNWLIFTCLRNLKAGEWPEQELIVHGIGHMLEEAFSTIIDPDDPEFERAKLSLEDHFSDDLEEMFRLHNLVP